MNTKKLLGWLILALCFGALFICISYFISLPVALGVYVLSFGLTGLIVLAVHLLSSDNTPLDGLTAGRGPHKPQAQVFDSLASDKPTEAVE